MNPSNRCIIKYYTFVGEPMKKRENKLPYSDIKSQLRFTVLGGRTGTFMVIFDVKLGMV